MKAIVVKSWLKTPQDMEIHDIPTPTPSSSELLIRIDSIGANFFDLLLIQGKYQHKPPFPFTPGSEFSGTVIKPSSKDPRFKAGDRVFGSHTTGAYAQYIAVPAQQCFPIPPKLTFEQASGLYITYPTSYAALVLRARLQKGEWVLVHAAAGGVGLAAVQIARALGAQVIAAVGSQEKFDICRSQGGAQYCVNYRDPEWTEQVMEITKGRGVDVVIDPVGLVEKSIKCVNWNARIVVVGFASGNIERVSMNRILLKNIAVSGLHWGAYAQREPERIPEVWKALFAMAEDGLIRPVVYQPIYYGLDHAKDALRAIANRETYGKVVVKPDNIEAKL